MSLKGKVAIVTGGNSGIGQAIVLELARLHANIVIDYVCRPEATEALEQQVGKLGDQSIGVKADVSKIGDLQTLIDQVRSGRHHGEQRRGGNPQLDPRHHRRPI
jgi:glucose 1-dehydrogenase